MLHHPFSSFLHAWRGIRYVFKTELNFRIHVVATIVVVMLGFIFQVSMRDWIIVLLLIMVILVLELLNSAFEKYIDILKPRLHEQVMIVKDILAGMVLIASLVALLIGVLVFYPYIIEPFM